MSKRILICDDDEALLGMIKFKLAKEGLGEVFIVTDGRSAIQALREKDFDLIVTDIHMPFHSGLEILTLLRNELKKNTPVLILSAEGLENTVMEAFEMGVNDFLTKPFSPGELSMRVKRLLLTAAA